MTTEKEKEILNTLLPYAQRKVKLFTDKKIKLGIRRRHKYNYKGKIYIADIVERGSGSSIYYLITFDYLALEKFSITNLKNIIAHEVSHIPSFEKPKLVTRYDKKGKPYKMYEDSHGKQFKEATKKAKVKPLFRSDNLNKLKKFK
jgi:hypothetical protein